MRRTPTTARYGTVVLARASASVEEAAEASPLLRSKRVVQTLHPGRVAASGVRCRTLCPNKHRQCIDFRTRMRRCGRDFKFVNRHLTRDPSLLISPPTHLPSGMAAPQPSSQGLGPSAKPDLLAGLVTEMRQLQDVLGKKEQATSSADEPETVKPGVSSLPKPPNTSPIDFQGWVTLLKAPMHDMSATSHLMRLSRPTLIMGRWSRVNSTLMLLAAIEERWSIGGCV